MPRAAAGNSAGAGAGAATVAEIRDKAGEVVAESGGGPEHLVSFDGLLTWPDVQVIVWWEEIAAGCRCCWMEWLLATAARICCTWREEMAAGKVVIVAGVVACCC